MPEPSAIVGSKGKGNSEQCASPLPPAESLDLATDMIGEFVASTSVRARGDNASLEFQRLVSTSLMKSLQQWILAKELKRDEWPGTNTREIMLVLVQCLVHGVSVRAKVGLTRVPSVTVLQNV